MNNQSSTKMERGAGLRLAIMLAALMFALLFAGSVKVQAATNGFRIEKGVSYYYKNGKKVTGMQTINGKKYLFKSNGAQVVGWQKDNNGKLLRYFINKKGAAGYMATGFYIDKKNNAWYFDPNTGLAARGWTKINGRYRYFDNKTCMAYRGMRMIDGRYYYFNKSNKPSVLGVRAEMGFCTVNGNMYYFSPGDGHVQVGWMTLNGKKYYFSKTGVMVKGIKQISKYWYYFDDNGVMAQNGWLKHGGHTYYYDKANGRAKTGWVTMDGKQYYFSAMGKCYINTTFTVDGVRYQSDKNGVVTKAAVTPTPTPTPQKSTFTVSNKGSYGTAYDSKYKRTYYIAREYFTHPGVADGTKSDRDLLAAIVEAEAGDQGLVGMEAVALCLLNRTIKSDHEFPAELKYVLYQVQFPSSYPQYSPVRDGALSKRLNGNFDNKSLAYQAADEALKIFNAYVKNKTPRVLKGFNNGKDHNFMYFMSVSAFYSQNLTFSKVQSYWYKVFNSYSRDHMFFVDWV